MGRQIYFVHTESDIPQFLSAIEGLNGRLVMNSQIILPSDVLEQVSDQMATPVCKYSIICPGCSDNPSYRPNSNVIDGTAIEFLNCSKGNTASRMYEVGRLYISPQKNGKYDVSLLQMYNLLSGYIKKNYLYSKKEKVYFSIRFKKEYDLRRIYAVQLGRAISF